MKALLRSVTFAVTVAFMLVVSVSAMDIAGPPFGTISVEVQRDPQNANSVWVKTVSRSGNVRSPGTTYDVRLRILRTSAGDSVTLANFTGQGSYNEGGLVASYSTSSTAYLWFNVWNWSDGQASEAVIGPVTIDVGGNVGLPPALQYAGSFSIPGNNTDHPVKYDVVQGGNVVGSVVQQPGAGPISYSVPGLQSGTPLHLKEITPGIKATPGGGFEADPGGPGYEREVGVTIPTQGSGGGGSTPAPVVSPTAPAAPSGGGAAVPPAPTVLNVNVDAPLKPVWVPKDEVAPGTTPGQSTSDFTIQAYREGVDKQVAVARAESQRIIDAAAARATASDTKTDAVKAAVQTGSADIKAAVQAGSADIKGAVQSVLSELQGSAPGNATFADPNAAPPVLTLNDPVAKATSKLPEAPTLSPITAASSITVSLEIPKLGGGSFTFNRTIDFSAAPYAGPIAVFRGILLVVLTLGFFVLSFFTVRGAFAGK